MLLTPYGLREWLGLTIICALLATAIGWFWWPGAIVIGVLWLALMSFFRDPIRRVPTDLPAGTMLSPADGVISAIEYLDDHEATGGKTVLIRIFLSVLNVHVNRAPFDCEVIELIHRPGKYLNAQTAESAKVNESNVIALQFPDGEKFGLKQISGMIARCIVCPLKPGDTLKRGEKFGMIKFGSTTELILPRPDDVDVLVTVGQKVRGGLTPFAVLKPRS